MESSTPHSVQLVYSILTIRNIVLSLLLYVALQCSYQVVYYRFFHPLAKFPGPFWAGVTRLWVAYPDLTGQERPKECRELHKRFGPVVRITPTMLFVSSSSAIPTIYRRHANKAKTYITGSFGEPENLFNVQDWKQHAQMRKLIAGSVSGPNPSNWHTAGILKTQKYSFTNVKKMEPLIDIQIQDWIDRISADFASKEEILNFATWSKYLAYDVIGEIGFGAPFGFIKTASDVSSMIKSFEDGTPIFGLLGRLYPFTMWIKKTWVGQKYLVAKPEDKSGWGTFMRLRDKIIDQRRRDLKAGSLGGRVDLLQTILDARTEDGKPLDPEYVKAEIVLVLIAGTDTTGTAVQSVMHFILTNEPVYNKLMAEVDGATKSGHLSAIPQFDEVLKHCPYYVACVKEALRLYPSAPATLARLAPPEGFVIEGMHIPGGTEVACNPWVIGRDEGLYGPDANEFRPERWLESEEQTAMYEKYNFVFGHGTRSCLGKDIALMELYKGPLQIFRRFRVHMDSEGVFAIKGGLGCWRDSWIRVAPRTLVGS